MAPRRAVGSGCGTKLSSAGPGCSTRNCWWVEAGGHRLLVVGHEDSGLSEVRDAVLSLLDRLEDEPADLGLHAELLAVARELHARLGGG